MTDATATSSDTPTLPESEPAAVSAPDTGITDALVERVFAAAIDTLEIGSVHIGGRLGFYRALADHGPATAAELAVRAGTVERYTREWLEQQAVAGFLATDGNADPGTRRYRLPPAHRPVFVDEDDERYLTPIAQLAVGVLAPLEALVAAYRGGDGVPYEDYGADVRDGIAALNRPQFVTHLPDWLASIPEVDARLRARPPARVADLACGAGWSSIVIAQTYPDVVVDAIDVDAASIADANEHVAGAGLGDRVRPRVLDAGDPRMGGPYDLVTIFEALHDMNHPVAALRAAREHLADGGSVVVADERVAERFTAPGDELERLNYGWSVLHCLTVGMLDDDSAGTGTVLRPATVHALAAEAGFGQVEDLPIEHDFWRFYRLVP